MNSKLKFTAESDGTIDNSGHNKLAISNGHGSKNHNLYGYFYEFSTDGSYGRESKISTSWRGLLPQSRRSKPITTPLDSGNSITAASDRSIFQPTFLAGVKEAFADFPTQATLSVANRDPGAKTARIDLRMIPVDRRSLIESTDYVVPQPPRHVSHPGPQRQFVAQIKVLDTAQSISFAMKGNIDGLKYLFSQGLASPREVSNSRGFSLVSVGLTTRFFPTLFLK